MDLSQAVWRTSSYTNAGNNNCVEVGPTAMAVGIRDTKARHQGALTSRRATFAALIRAVQGDQFIR
jgi:hypothetical protein